jgi:radical SAM superfamily enzyme YgiQ (UPF0313 family)
MVLWNSVARRRRSISDTFYDNGLATLKGYLEARGHEVEVIDWATDDFYASLSPVLLARPLRRIYGVLIRTKSPVFKLALGLVSMRLQDLLGAIQQARLDARLRALAASLKAKGTRVVGVKLWYGEAFSNALRLIELLKKVAPEILTVAGGYHVTLYEERILKVGGFDLCVEREGEHALYEIMRIAGTHEAAWDKAAVLAEVVALAEAGEIANLVYRTQEGTKKSARLDADAKRERSAPIYDGREGKVGIHVVTESFGCDWGKCHFCVHRQFSSSFSIRAPEDVVAEIKDMLRIGVGVFRFAGSDTPPAFGARIARKLIENRIDVVFAMGSRAIKGAEAKFESLVESYTTLIQGGLRAVFMGGETGNDLINEEAMNKGVGYADIVATIRALREAEKRAGHRVYLSLAFIYPTPTMGKVDLEEVKQDNLRLLRETRPESVMITPPGPFLHTAWYAEQKRFGFELNESAIEDAMQYEYVLYKPPQFWPMLGIKLDGKPFSKILAECGEFRGLVQKELGIPTDVSDEHFLMFYAAGIRSMEEIMKAKDETMLDILSCDYRKTRAISARVNEFSRSLGASNAEAVRSEA